MRCSKCVVISNEAANGLELANLRTRLNPFGEKEQWSRLTGAPLFAMRPCGGILSPRGRLFRLLHGLIRRLN